MKILQICNKFPYPPSDGGALATLSMTRQFSARGHKVTILAINTSKHYFNPTELPDDIKKLATFDSVFLNTDIRFLDIIKNLIFSTTPYNAARFISIDFSTRIIEILREQPFDLVQLEGLYLCPYIDVIRKHSNALIAYRAHNVEYEIWKRFYKNQSHLIKKAYASVIASRVRKFELKYLNKYDALIPITERDAQKINEMGNIKPMLVIPMSIHPNEYNNYPVYTSSNSLFHLGGLDWPPNQQGLLWFLEKIWPALCEKNLNLTFKIAGRNAPEWLEKKLKSHANVEYFGKVPDAKKFIAESGIMVVPLLSGSGMRIKIMEGLALGKTIISTSIGAEGINIKHGQNILIANTIEEFLKEVTHALSDEKKQIRLGENARRLISEQYNSDTITKKLTTFYQDMLLKNNADTNNLQR